MLTFDDYREGASALSEKLGGFRPEVLIILGSGLGNLGDRLTDPIVIPYREIPHMRFSTAPGHKGRFLAGRLGGRNVLMMQGRLHIYEGWAAEDAVFPVRIAKLIGVESMIVTNAAGGINTGFKPGELMLISDFIKLNCVNPLIGPNIEKFGPRFPDMSKVFDREYMAKFRAVAEAKGENIHEGVYFYCTGPQYETPAEIRAMRLLGADAVGMSTVPECIAARHCGMRILGITLVTNMAAGILDKPLSGEEVIEAGNASSERLSSYVEEFLERM
ncbi:MAG: purine-nucleoside phosphorylase [Clostridiales bacterium]|nr:purine-nucleoside phosphorylase [Clostridiales bacterium]